MPASEKSFGLHSVLSAGRSTASHRSPFGWPAMPTGALRPLSAAQKAWVGRSRHARERRIAARARTGADGTMARCGFMAWRGAQRLARQARAGDRTFAAPPAGRLLSPGRRRVGSGVGHRRLGARRLSLPALQRRRRRGPPPDCAWAAEPRPTGPSRSLKAYGLGRDLINTPAGDLGPQESLRAAARTLAERHGAQLTSIVGDELLARNFPMIHAVGPRQHAAACAAG